MAGDRDSEVRAIRAVQLAIAGHSAENRLSVFDRVVVNVVRVFALRWAEKELGMSKTTVIGVLQVVIAVAGLGVAVLTGDWAHVAAGVTVVQGLLCGLGFKVAADVKPSGK